MAVGACSEFSSVFLEELLNPLGLGLCVCAHYSSKLYEQKLLATRSSCGYYLLSLK